MPVGSTVGRYRIIEEIDRGGMAVVYRAMQLDLGREVALKVMPANITLNNRFIERFLSEAHSVAKLSHPNIVTTYEVAAQNNIYYLAMEYIPGKNLYHFLHETKPKLVDVLEIIARLADALAYAHSKRIIHRDLKLNNVIMKDRLTPVLIDFGLAKAIESEDTGITRTGEIMGSPAYMAPERLTGARVDHRSDICSLGIMLYEMLTFQNPYLDQSNLHQTTINVMEANPTPPRKIIQWLPSEVEAIILKAMAKDSANRYQSMQEFKEDINRYQRGEPVMAQPPSLWYLSRRFLKRHWAPLVIFAIILAFSSAFLTSRYIQSRRGLSRLQLVYEEEFIRAEALERWSIIDIDGRTGTMWVTDEGHLRAQSQGLSYALLNETFNRDLRIDLEIGAVENDLFNAGIFLFGDNPNDAYCIHINRNGTGEAGITFPNSSFLFTDITDNPIQLKTINRVTVERIDKSLSLTINDQHIAKIYDFFPPRGEGHEKIGFFVNNGTADFINPRIYRRSIPLVPSPTLIAMRFWERGDFQAAKDEYEGLLIQQNNPEKRRELLIKVADCKIRMGQYNEALQTLEKSALLATRDGEFSAQENFLKAVTYRRLGQYTIADSINRAIDLNHSNSPVNFSVQASALKTAAEALRRNQFQVAERIISAHTPLNRRYIHMWAQLHLSILKHYSKEGLLQEAEEVAERIIALYPQHQIQTQARTLLGETYLNRGRISAAAEIFNQCAHTNDVTSGVWGAWMNLAEIYEYDFSYEYALSLYEKVHREVSEGSLNKWLSAIKTGEIKAREAKTLNLPIFRDVIDSHHPFPLPRLIAKYYLDEISESGFIRHWNHLQPQNPNYLFHVAFKASIQGNTRLAQAHLYRLGNRLSPRSWEYFKVLRIQNNFDRW
ncbi:serine/threonine-protein kinase [Chitinispirillales bacterium ANBcel5]|uniref:protein kinase domain-containing protein n=1 Tax=Cellulosispirillum alkaliphilum TaxID=3039283 RepID=UPI002A53D9EE|nr:serine/threonine-protein kinase [Chitinispirillales bacterium ANBcel5]